MKLKPLFEVTQDVAQPMLAVSDAMTAQMSVMNAHCVQDRRYLLILIQQVLKTVSSQATPGKICMLRQRQPFKGASQPHAAVTVLPAAWQDWFICA